MFLACANVGRWWWIMCFLCPKLQTHNIFFIYFMLHPCPPFCFLSKVVSVQCFFFWLHVAPHPFLCVFCVHNSKHTTLFFNVACCTSPHPPFFYDFKIQSSKCAKFFFIGCCTYPPFLYVFRVQNSKHIMCFFFYYVLHLPPFFFVFCVQTSKHAMCCFLYWVSHPPCLVLCFLCPEFQGTTLFAFRCVLHPPLFLCVFLSKPPSV